MNKNYNYTKSLIMYHYLICCKLKFYLQKNNKLYILNIYIITSFFLINKIYF